MSIYRKGEDQFELEHRAVLQGDESSIESKKNKELLRDKSIKVHRTSNGGTELRKHIPSRKEYTHGGKSIELGGYSYGYSPYWNGISGRDVADVRSEK